jgi:hypothetical protein
VQRSAVAAHGAREILTLVLSARGLKGLVWVGCAANGEELVSLVLLHRGDQLGTYWHTGTLALAYSTVHYIHTYSLH